jgi:non-homologous end joining protein Ku
MLCFERLLEKTGLAAIGKVTMSTKERVVLIHYYRNAIVATTLGTQMR